MARTKWPTEVPILDASDIVQGPFTDGRGACCTIEWSYRVFDICGNNSVGDQVYGSLNDAAKEMGAVFTDKPFDSPELYSDNRKNSPCLVARIWNRAMAKLGYVVGNPEAKNLKRTKP